MLEFEILRYEEFEITYGFMSGGKNCGHEDFCETRSENTCFFIRYETKIGACQKTCYDAGEKILPMLAPITAMFFRVRGENLQTDVLLKICKALNVGINDIMDTVEDDEES